MLTPLTEKDIDYLKDESLLIGHAQSISFPTTEFEIIEILRQCREQQTPITLQGSRTGLCGAAVPLCGHIMSLRHLNSISCLDAVDQQMMRVTVQAGLTLEALEQYLNQHAQGWFWPANPTEKSATIGGIIANGAQGLYELGYGKTHRYVHTIKVIDISGCTHLLSNADGQEEDDLSFLDLFSSEGMFAIISEITLKLCRQPNEMWGIALPFEHTDVALQYAKQSQKSLSSLTTVKLAAMEFLDITSLQDIEQENALIQGMQSGKSWLYLELHADGEGDCEAACTLLLEVCSCYQIDEESILLATGIVDCQKWHSLRHRVVEMINLRYWQCKQQIPTLTRLVADFSFHQDQYINQIVVFNKELMLKKIRYSMWGHVGLNKMQIHLLPENHYDYQLIQSLLKNWYQHSLDHGIEPIGEQGIGKIMPALYFQANLAQYQLRLALKNRLDVNNLLNQGNWQGDAIEILTQK